MNDLAIAAETVLEQMIDAYPQTCKVFLKYSLRCVGCPISHHHRVVDCVTENDLDLESFLAELRAAVASSEGA